MNDASSYAELFVLLRAKIVSLRWRWVFYAIFIALIGGSAGVRAYAAGSAVPDWVKAAAEAQLPHYPASTKAIVLLAQTTFTVAPSGRATEHVRRVVKVLRPQGREEAVPVVFFDNDSKVVAMHVWTIGPDGHEYTVKDNEIQEIGIPGGGGELYSDDRVKVLPHPPGCDPGGIVALEYEQVERPYIAEKTWFFQTGIPAVDESFTLVLPQGFTHTTTWAHHPADKEIDLEHQSWRWVMHEVPAVDLDEVAMSPAARSLAGRMTVHYGGSSLDVPQEGTWKGIGEWFDTLSRDRLAYTPEIAAKSAELTQGKTDFYDKVEAIGEYAQSKIRYVAIELGIGGFQPHSAGDVFRGKYGDCKDKATLMSSMFASVGVHSALLMVHTERGVIDPESPSTLGNHMIGAIEIPKGYESPKLRSVVTAKTGKRYLIFDPTWEETPFGQLEDNLQGSYGVLMEGKDSQVIQLPILDPELNRVRRSAIFQLAANGELKGKVTERRFGDVAVHQRRVFSNEDLKTQQKYMDAVVNRDLPAASVTDLKVENVSALNKDLTTSFAVDSAGFARQTGPLLMVRPRVLGSYLLLVDHKPRLVPVNLSSTRHGTDEFDIDLPAGYTVDELPEPIKVDVGFASYESSTVLRGQTLHYSRSFTVRQVTLPADKYSELQKLASVIAADEQSTAILKRVP